MGYKHMGFVVPPRSLTILNAATTITAAFKNDLDKEIAKAIKSLGKENVRLTNFFFERLLTVDHPRFDSDPELKKSFLILLADFLRAVGFIDTSPVTVDYVTDPTIPEEELIWRMLDARMPKFSAADLGGEYATVDTLTYWFPEVIRRHALIKNEAHNMTERFRKWIGAIGHKLLTGGAISQQEKTAYVMYCSNSEGTTGHVEGMSEEPIPAIENGDVLVAEVGELYKALTLSGPFTSHQKLVSDQIMERLTFYFGPHNPDLKMCTGYIKTYGPFSILELVPQEAIPWTLEDQLIGITGNASYFMGMRSPSAGFSLKIPLMVANWKANGIAGAFPDDPSIRLILTNQKDISQFEFEYFSKFRGRNINSVVNNATLELALCDAAAETKAAGACQLEHPRSKASALWILPNALQAKFDSTITIKSLKNIFFPATGGWKRSLRTSLRCSV